MKRIILLCALIAMSVISLDVSAKKELGLFKMVIVMS